MITRTKTTRTHTHTSVKDRNEREIAMTSLTGNLERAQQRAFNVFLAGMCEYGDERLVRAFPTGPAQTLLLFDYLILTSYKKTSTHYDFKSYEQGIDIF